MRVVLDACVLYPPSLRDLLLTLAALDAFDVVWSETILGELRRNVVADNPDVDPDRFSDHTLAEMRRHFPAAMVSVGPDDIDRFDNDPKDRHVAAVAVVAAADAVVTINVKDFRSRVLDESGIAIQTPGGLIERYWMRHPNWSTSRPPDCQPLDQSSSHAGRGGGPFGSSPDDGQRDGPSPTNALLSRADLLTRPRKVRRRRNR